MNREPPFPPPRTEADPVSECVDSRKIGGSPATAWCSTAIDDQAWDDFLQSTPLGHFQQSSMWASVKAGEGWRPVRVVIRQSDQILGGFQILSRPRGWLREGFLNKGPVYGSKDPGLLGWLIELVARTVKQEGIDLLLSQTPDADQALDALQGAHGYAPDALTRIITATLCVPLGGHLPPVESRMRKTIQQEARQAVRRGTVVREGGEADLGAFFAMMCVTCRRQNTQPNPATEESLRRLWNAFHARGLVRLTIADCDGKPTAGVFAIRFGNRVTQWKKGWNEEFREKHPNTLLTYESIRWAEQQGVALYDFVGVDRPFARSIVEGVPPEKGLLASRYFFMMGFGSEAKLLPLGRVLIRNRFIRGVYRAALPALFRLGRSER
ncbi:MAG: GNAT family N-acetyltransferase [Verrucomicrobia bacterium]|nr:GNAT family N-acetyltransferase [Verrucomicrobiota bacterium]